MTNSANNTSNADKDEVNIKDILIELSGVNTTIVNRIPASDKRPYFKVAVLNIVISIVFAASCYFIGKILFNFSNYWAIGACIVYFGISLYVLKIITGNLINRKTSESMFSFFLPAVLISLIAGLSLLLILAAGRLQNYNNKVSRIYIQLDSLEKNIVTKRKDTSDVKFVQNILQETNPQDVNTYVLSYFDGRYQDYRNFSGLALQKYGSLVLRDTFELSEKLYTIAKTISKTNDNMNSQVLGPTPEYNDTNTIWKATKETARRTAIQKATAVREQVRTLYSIPDYDLSTIKNYFDPNRFKTITLGEKLWYISYYSDASALGLFILVVLIAMLFFLFIFIISNTYSKDFYHQLLMEEEKLKSEALEKQRKKISDEFRLQAEIRNTKISLENIENPNEENKKEISKIIGGLNNDLSPATLKTASEFEFQQGRHEKALEYINKAIEIEDEINSKKKDYMPNPEFYELKGKILTSLSNSDEAKVALDRFAELNNEKKYQLNLAQEILLQRLEVENLPFYGNFKWVFTPGINILLGKNGYGKSHLFSLLIALLYDDKTKIREWIPPTSSLSTRAKLYIYSDHKNNEQLISDLMNLLDELGKKKQEMENRRTTIDPKNESAVQQLNAELAVLNTEIQNTAEKIDAEQKRILGNKDGITGNIGRIPVLGIPDSRFIDKSENAFGNNKILSEDLKRDGATEFLYSRSFAEIIKKGLFIVAQNNATDFKKEPYAFIERVISDLAGTNQQVEQSNLVNKNSIAANSSRFFRFVRVETSSTTGDYKFYVKSEESEDEFPLQKISQGTFSVLAICLMVYRFLCELKPASKNVFQEKAIIFIDEIDAHLHPSWEQKIIGILRREFPNVQFVISAHSPLIVAGCFENEVSVLKRTPDGFSIEQSKENFIGYSASDLLKKVFEIEDKDEQYLHYSALADQEDELKRKLSEFEKKESVTDSELMNMDELSKQLNYIKAVKKIKSKNVDASILKTQNQSLKAEIDILKDKIKNSQIT